MIVVAARGEASEPVMSCFAAAVRNAVRYADPISWTGATAAALALKELGEAIGPMRAAIGVIAMSNDGPAQAIAAVAEASAAGFSSPLKYPAANPGSLAGVTCITQELHGPTMNLTMPVEVAIPVGLMLARGWVERGVCPLVVLVAARRGRARCLVVGQSGGEALKSGAWLAMGTEGADLTESDKI